MNINQIKKGLEALVVGQRDAIKAIVDHLTLYEAKLLGPDKPVGTFILAGPSGCGKTNLVLSLAQVMHGSKHSLIRVDCAEFSHGHEVAKLIGAPPGYLGHRETEPVFTQHKLDEVTSEECPIAIVLFDEIEKGHKKLYDILLGLMDYGRLSTGSNADVMFHNALIVFTSNIGLPKTADSYSLDGSSTSLPPEVLQRRIRREVDKFFAKEFLNRITKVLVMPQLTLDECVEIARKEFFKQVRGSAYKFHIADGALERIAHEGWDPDYGARNIARFIQDNIVVPAAKLLLEHKPDPFNSTINITDDLNVAIETTA